MQVVHYVEKRCKLYKNNLFKNYFCIIVSVLDNMNLESSNDIDELLVTSSQEQRFYKEALSIISSHKNSNESDTFETNVSILATTISCPMWYHSVMRIRKMESGVCLLFVTSKDTVMHILPLSIMSYVMLNPDNYEVRIESKPIHFTNSGWFIFRFENGMEYEMFVDKLQTYSSEVYKNIVFEYKTKQQDKRYGLISNEESRTGLEKIIHRQFKNGYLNYRVYS